MPACKHSSALPIGVHLSIRSNLPWKVGCLGGSTLNTWQDAEEGTMFPSVKTSKGTNLREQPCYPISYAAHLTQVPKSTLRAWVAGRNTSSPPAVPVTKTRNSSEENRRPTNSNPGTCRRTFGRVIRSGEQHRRPQGSVAASLAYSRSSSTTCTL